jgi:hypothetical protein
MQIKTAKTAKDNSPPSCNRLYLNKHLKTYTMKQAILLLTVVFFFSTSSFAQLDKHTWLVGGSTNFYLSKRNYTSYVNSNLSGNSDELNLSISPNVGYLIFEKLGIGLRPYFSWGKGNLISSNGSEFTSDSKRYGIGPFVRYYLLNKEKPFNILTDIGYQIGEWNAGGQKGQLKDLNFSIGPVIYFNSTAGIEFLLGYNSHSEVLKNYSKNESKGFNVSIGFQLHLIK